jgi:hypothetical protein
MAGKTPDGAGRNSRSPKKALEMRSICRFNRSISVNELLQSLTGQSVILLMIIAGSSLLMD